MTDCKICNLVSETLKNDTSTLKLVLPLNGIEDYAQDFIYHPSLRHMSQKNFSNKKFFDKQMLISSSNGLLFLRHLYVVNLKKLVLHKS